MTLQRLIIGKQFKEIQVPSESIYNLNPQTTEAREIQPRSPYCPSDQTSAEKYYLNPVLYFPEVPEEIVKYQSKYSSATRKFYESGKKPHQTMGYAKTPLKSPREYLKKQTRDSHKTIERKPFTCLNENNKKPPVPKRDEVPLILHETPNKDFIKWNTLTALKTPALKPTPKSVDTRRGDSFLLEFSGLVPKFLRKEEFGKTPKYLVQRRKGLEYSKEMFEKSKEEQKLIPLSEQEKINLIEGLRANWEELNTRYLSLPLRIDTKPRQHRKLELERKLDALEQDISFLEKNKDVDIYILPE